MLRKDHPYRHLVRSFCVDHVEYFYFDVQLLAESTFDKLPFCVRILLESAVRNCNFSTIQRKDIDTLLNFPVTSPTFQNQAQPVPFFPARTVFQDFTSLPTLIDLVLLRQAAVSYGIDPLKVQPMCPIDLLLDRCFPAVEGNLLKSNHKNYQHEFYHCEERLSFIKWTQNNFNNISVIPPGTSSIHHINMLYLARVVYNNSNLLYPDSSLGVDSHCSFLNGIGVLSWPVGGMMSESLVLGKPASIRFPEVVGYYVEGDLDPLVTSTDLVLAIVKNLIGHNVKGCFLEFFGPGISLLSIPERCGISHMSTEHGAIVGFFPMDQRGIDFLKSTGRDEKSVKYTEKYLKLARLFQDYGKSSLSSPMHYSRVIKFDLSQISSCCSGPKRSADRIPVRNLKDSFLKDLTAPPSSKGFGLPVTELDRSANLHHHGKDLKMTHGAVFVASINSCTNISNPNVILTAGLLAKNAVKIGLKTLPWVSTSLAPGFHGPVHYYLKAGGVIPYLEELGFQLIDLQTNPNHITDAPSPLSNHCTEFLKQKQIVSCEILSGNRNFEHRVSTLIDAHYLLSPPLVIVYSIVGSILFDFDSDPIGKDLNGSHVYLRDIWPSRKQVQTVEEESVFPSIFSEINERILLGGGKYSSISIPTDSVLFPWNHSSTFIQAPPYFNFFSISLPPLCGISNAHCLIHFGDSISTDLISPAGSISRNSPAARYLASCGLCSRDLCSYGARRGNYALMACGTFSNSQIKNFLVKVSGPYTLHVPSNRIVDIYTCSKLYANDGIPSIVMAGKNFGCGSSRDWAAKGPWLLGVRAVIAQSFDPIYRTELIEAGILPLVFMPGQSASSLRLSGKEGFTIEIPYFIFPHQTLRVSLSDWRVFQVQVCIQNDMECLYYQHGGILPYTLRSFLKS